MSLKVAITAGEASGDALGAGLMASLRGRCPDVQFVGIPGPMMSAFGCRSLYPIERLSVMGLVEAAGRLLELVPVRRRLVRDLVSQRPDLLIGIDAPDFNFALERGVRRAGIPTVHYVSPSVWAWRRYRVARIARSVDLMLTLFPFEAQLYRDCGVAVRYVGHPLADTVEPGGRRKARQRLGLGEHEPVVALLPGSRTTEADFLAEPLISTARWLAARRTPVRFVVPFVNRAIRSIFVGQVPADEQHRFVFVDRQSHDCLAAADVVLLASGTATLEAMLIGVPMVITYRSNALTYWIMERWVGRNVRFAGLPNLLAGRLLVPELMQQRACPRWLGPAVLAGLDDSKGAAEQRREFGRIHDTLRCGASGRAADAVLGLLRDRRAA